MLCIAYRYWSKNSPVLYVSDLKGKKGDWGYTDRLDRAIPLSDYWQKRFSADCREVGVTAQFIPVNELERA